MAKIKRFGVLSVASFLGLYGAFLGFIFGLIFAIATSLIVGLFVPGSVGGAPVDAKDLLPGIFSFGWLGIILFPIFYGGVNFVIGLILTPLMNLTLKITKGLDLDVEMEGQPSTPMAPKYNNPTN